LPSSRSLEKEGETRKKESGGRQVEVKRSVKGREKGGRWAKRRQR
jgi:hypothetical protein